VTDTTYSETVANATNLFAPTPLSDALDFYAKHGAALFPVPRGQKAPFGIISSFKHDHSQDREQWRRWAMDHFSCNFGVVAYASGWIICDIDTSGGEAGAAEARALWAELCASWGLPEPLPFHVESQSGGFHVYFVVPAGVDASNLRQPDAIKGRINVRCVGYTLTAGSQFEGRPYRLLTDAPPHPAPGALIKHCTRSAPRKIDGASLPGAHDEGDVAALLNWMAEKAMFADYEDWLAAGMALKTSFGSDGFFLWDLTHDGSVSPGQATTKWESFSSGPVGDSVTIASLMKKAHAAGWTGSIRKSTSVMFQGVAQLAAAPSIVPELPPLPYSNGEEEAPKPTAKLIQSSGEFVANFVAPSFLIDGVIQKQNVYALTAAPGTGKTAIAMRIAAHVALGRKLGDRDVERGRVLYFAAENYVDVQARLIAMAEHCGFDVNAIEIYFVAGTSKLSEIAVRITAEAQALGDLTLVIVDTSAATFEGSDENSNVDGLVHAKRMRSLTELRGKPTVLVLCHPVKSATNDNLLPRGGSAFFGEIDGNLCARKNDSAVELHWFGKIRGMDFAPIAFRLDTVVADRLKDARGRKMPTVLATPIDDASKQVLAATERSDQDRVLRAISERPGESSNEIAKRLGWAMRDGKPYGVRVRRAAERMAGDGLLTKHRGEWVLSARGEKELNNLDRKIAVPSGTSAVPLLPPFPPRNAH
jgi:Bifunctional DNA primase/polymerase, N-terminal/AAA domain/Primase C terminal 2 (PriCT-2)